MLNNDYAKNRKLFRVFAGVVLVALILTVFKQVILKPAKTDEQALYDTFYEASKRISSDVQQRKILADCCLQQIKSKYSDIESVNSDSIATISNLLIEECAKKVTTISWTPEIERAAIRKFSSHDNLKSVSVEKRTAYARCVLTNLKSRYPNGLGKAISQTEMYTIYNACIDVLK